jgi:peptidoglycan/xylan/chitin deacetylase (PgdA/CDA1 family)
MEAKMINRGVSRRWFFFSLLGLFLLAISLSSRPLFAVTPVDQKPDLAQTPVPVLCYHRIIPKMTSIYDLTPVMLEQQFKFFKAQGFHPITAQQYIRLQSEPSLFPPKPIILTFDDGNKSHYRYVLPLLKKYGYQATFFVYPNAVAQRSAKLITWDELAQMAEAGMDIESHTMSHPFLMDTKFDLASPRYLQWLDHELKDSKTVIERRLNVKVNILAYPFGWYDSVVESRAVAAGYRGIFTVNWGLNSLDENPLRLKRKVMSSQMDLASLERYITARPIAFERIMPSDGEITSQMPVIKFKFKNQEFHKVNIEIKKDKVELLPDDQGIFTYRLKDLKPRYYMVIITGYDDQNQFHMSSWGFDYRKP